MYDDQTVKVTLDRCACFLDLLQVCVIWLKLIMQVIGGWNDVLTMCERGHLQPQVLFFEAVN